jgi:hypothetical protein
MKSIYSFIKLQESAADNTRDVVFNIYDEQGNTVSELDDDSKFQKIEYTYNDEFQFLLGKTDNKWYLWVGKPGVVAYSDPPYKELDTKQTSEAINLASKEIGTYINKHTEDDTTDGNTK